MPHWNASDFETIFDSDSGEGTSGTFSTSSERKSARENSVAYVIGDKVDVDGDDYFQKCVLAGTSDASAPTVNTNKPGDTVTSLVTDDFSEWSKVGSGSVTDNSVYWTFSDTDVDTNEVSWSHNGSVLNDSLEYTVIWEIQKPTTGQTKSQIGLVLLGGGAPKAAAIIITWADNTINTNANLEGQWFVAHPVIANRFYLIMVIKNNSTGNTTLQNVIRPSHVINEIGDLDIYGFSIIKASQPLPPTLKFTAFAIINWSELFTVENDGVVWVKEGATTPYTDDYTLLAIIDHGLAIVDEDFSVPEKTVLLQFLKHKLTNSPVRGDTWSDGVITYTIQSLASDDGIIETWSVTS